MIDRQIKLANESNILRVKLRRTDTGQGLTGLAYNTSGLIISTICDNEATATSYTAAGSTIEAVGTLGTFAAPTATKCRFSEVDSTNHPGTYELQFANARFAVANSKVLRIGISGAANLLERELLIELVGYDPITGAVASVSGAVGSVTGAVGSVTAGVTITAGQVVVKKNAALANFPFIMYLSSDHITPATGKTVACQRSIDGGAFANCATATATEVASGMYKISLADTDLNGTTIMLKMTNADCDPTFIGIMTQP